MGVEKNLNKTFYMECIAESKELVLEDQEGCIEGCEYLGVKVDKEHRQENDNKNNESRAKRAILNCVLWSREMTRKKYYIYIIQ